MPVQFPVPEEKKLVILVRLEPGCLGPEGESHIDDFCKFAHVRISDRDADFISWLIVPRHDKSLPEMEYRVHDKRLSERHAEKYLGLFERHLETVEEEVHEQLAHLIDEYLGH